MRMAIHGVPRSGTTWMGSLFNSSGSIQYFNQPLFSYAFKGRLNNKSSKTEVLEFFKDVSESKDEFINQSLQKSEGSIPVFDKMDILGVAYKEARYHHLIPHLLSTDDELFMFLIIRNPLGVLASWLNAPKEFDSQTMDFLEEWRNAPKKNEGRIEEYYGFNKWKEFALMAHRIQEEYPERCMIIAYSELLEETELRVKDCFSFCGVPFRDQTKEFIIHSRSRDMSEDAYSVFRVKSEDKEWKTILPQSVIDEVHKDLMGTELEIYLQ